MENELAFIKRDEDGNIIISNNRNVTCVSEGGKEFEICYDEIDFNSDDIRCSVDGKMIVIPLHNDTINEEANKENDAVVNEIVFSWNDSSTKLFLSLYKDQNELLKTRKIKTKKILWSRIASKMRKNGYNVTVLQVENKFKSLERSYKNMISNNKKTGRGRMTCSFETELSELLGSKHNIEPLAVCGSKGLIVREVIRTNTPLPMESMDDINMSNVNPKEVENISIENNSTEATNNNLKQTLKKNERKHLGATARMLESCQKTIEQFATSVQGDSNNKYDVQKEMLEEYKKIRVAYEECVKQFTRTNDLKEEKNVLLKEIFLGIR